MTGNLKVFALACSVLCGQSFAGDFYKFTNYDPDSPEHNLDYAGFETPSGMSRVQTWWHWVDGNVTREGIEKDLAEMADKGYGGAVIFQFGIQFGHDYIQPGPLKIDTPEWYDTFSFVVDTAAKNNMQIGIHNCDGWTEAAGPWVPVELSMKRLTWSKAKASGNGKEQVINLSEPGSTLGFYRDIAVVAWPSVRTGELKMSAALKGVKAANGESVEVAEHPLTDMFSGNGENLPHARIMADKKDFGSYGFAMEFDRPFEAAGVFMRTNNWRVRPKNLWLEASDDGKKFDKVVELDFEGQSVDSYKDFKPRAAKYWRVMRYRNGEDFDENNDFANLKILDIMEFELLAKGEVSRIAAGIKDYRRKANLDDGYTYAHIFEQINFHGFDKDLSPVPQNATVKSKDVKVFRNAIDENGNFKWKVPEGDWEIMRLGYTVTGKTNDPATDAGRGLEIDKFSGKALDFHFDRYVKKMIDAAGDKAGSVFKYVETDSWECGLQNWTEDFDKSFRDLNGYDFFAWVPVLDGNIVDGKEDSESFMADYRRTTSRMIMDNFYGRFAERLHENGLLYETEPSVHLYMQDWPETFKFADLPQDEVWQPKREPGKILSAKGKTRFDGAPSAAHFYGKQFVTCETATSLGGDWANSPATLKGTLDRILLGGYNIMVFHSFVHQPDERQPGWQMEPWGTSINRKQTWWQMSKPFFAYLNRIQYMMQQGRPDARILNLFADEVPALNPTEPTPPGILVDSVTAGAVRDFLKVEDGRLVSPGKMKYDLLSISPGRFMRAETLRAIKKYVEEGATVAGYFYDEYETRIGGKKARAEWKKLNKELFGGKEKSVRKIGKGTVYANYSLVEAAEEMKIPEAVKGDDVLWTKRVDESGRAWYWVLNNRPEKRRVNLSFDVSGRKPYFWNPEDGSKKAVPFFIEQDDRTAMMFELDGNSNIFVVFENEAPGLHIKGYGRNGEAAPLSVSQAEFFSNGDIHANYSDGSVKTAEVQNLPAPMEIKPPFDVEFDEKWGGPKSSVFGELKSWTENENPGIKHYSGTAKYRKNFELPKLEKGRKAYIEFDGIAEIAEVYINGKLAGTLWTAPFVLDITDFVTEGENALEVRVANTWVNRCLYDSTLPEGERLTWGNNMRFHYPAAGQQVPWGEPWRHGPLPSGIMGKVKIVFSQVAELK